jgi:hypothetical protein
MFLPFYVGFLELPQPAINLTRTYLCEGWRMVLSKIALILVS